MADWILLALLGLLTYVILRRGAARYAAVPWWVLWGVMMFPPVALVVSVRLFQEQIPALVLLGLFFLSYVISVVLMQRRAPNAPPDLPPVLTPPPKRSSVSEISQDQLRGCFPWTVYYLQELEYKPQAVICRGNLRAEPAEAYAQVRANVEERFGDQFLLVMQEGLAGKPFFALVPNVQQAISQERPLLAIVLAGLTVLTTVSAGAIAAGVTPEQIQTDASQIWLGIPYAMALILILGVHELGHYFAARWHKLPTSLPYFIPVPFAFGTFGALVTLRRPVPDRKTLFDLAIAAPLAAICVALPLLIWALSQATVIPYPSDPPLLTLQEFDPRLSILLAILTRIVMGEAVGVNEIIQFNAFGVAAWIGVLLITLNLMPFGQLGGGHIVHAVFGHQMGATIGRITRILIFFMSFTIQRWLWVWALILLLLPSTDEPALDDVTELNEGRDFLGLTLLALVAVVILPAPPALQLLLGMI